MRKGKLMVRLKGDFYSSDTYCNTLKEFLEIHKGLKRSDIAEWWRELKE